MNSAQEPFEVGCWKADPAANELRGDRGTVRVAPKAMATLAMLQAERGEVVTRLELCDRIGLSDEGLSRTVSELRKAIEEKPRSPIWLQTIPRRGYRLNASPEPRDRRRTVVRPWMIWPALLVAIGFVWLVSRPSAPVVPELSEYQTRRLTAFEGRAVTPRLEEDAVVFERFDADARPMGLWRLELDTLALAPLALDPQVRRRLAMDGKTIATLRSQQGRCRIQLSGATLDCRDVGGNMDFHRARGWLAFEDAEGGIARVSLDGSSLRRLTDPPAGKFDRNPRFSPDGERLLFARGDDVGAELYVVAAGGGNALPMTDDDQMVFGHDWLDDERMIFSSDREGVRELWLKRGPEGSPRSMGGFWAMDLDADRRRVIYESPVYRADIFETTPDGASPLIESARYDNHPRFSPDGRRLVFLSNRTGRTALWLANSDGSNQRLLFEAPDIRITRPRWFGDAQIVFAAFDGSGSEIRQVDLTGNTQVLVRRSWAPLEAVGHAERLWFIGRDSGGPAIFLRDSNGTIVRAHALDARQIEVDGRGRLYVELTDRPGVFLADHDLANPMAQPILPRSWVVNGDFLAWAGPRGIVRARLSDRQQSFLSPLAPNVVGHGMEISPDGQRLLVARTTRVQTDLYELRLD